jgi:hypothetical protein
MKNGEKIYVVCGEKFLWGQHWPCGIFRTRANALKHCKKRAEQRTSKDEFWFDQPNPRKGSKFIAEKAKGPQGQEGYGRKRCENNVEWSWLDYSVVFYVQEYELGKKAGKVELCA